MLVSCHSNFSGPIVVRPDSPEGFLLDAIRRLENREIKFTKRDLPAGFRGNGGFAEVRSPFTETLMMLEMERMDHGSFIEIKLRAEAEDAKKLWPLLRHTRKGHHEILSGEFGMRGFNTFLGKAVTNKLLSPICGAMFGLAENGGMNVMPVSASYLTYWVNMPPSEHLLNTIRKAIEETAPRGGPAFMGMLGRPSVSVLDATQVDVEDVRAKFILKRLGREGSDPRLLFATDFMMNFIENVRDKDDRNGMNVKEEIYDKLEKKENGGKPISRADREFMDTIKEICRKRRTIRDTEDLVYVATRDETLPEAIGKSRKQLDELVEWVFEFAEKRMERIAYLLAEKIESISSR
jgi:hypothetical protein